MMWAVCMPPYFFAFFQRTATSVFGVELAALFGLSGAVTGLLAAMYFYIYAAMQLPNGFLADSVGPRRMMLFGGLIMGAATTAFAFPLSLTYAMIVRFCIGFGASFYFVAILKLQTNWFTPAEFPLISGLTIFIGNCGALFGVGPFALLAAAFTWQMVFIVFGLLTIIFAVIGFLIVRDHPAQYSKPHMPPSLKETLKTIFTEPRNYCTLIAFAFSNGPYIAFASLWGVPFLMHCYGITKIDASGFTVWLPIGVAFGCMFNGIIAARFGSERRALLTILSFAAIGWAIIAFVRFPGNLWLYRPVFFALGFCIASLNLIFTTVQKHTPAPMSGSAFAFTNMGGFIMISTLQPLCGFILDLSVGVRSPGSIPPVYPDSAYRIMLSMLLIIHCLSVAAYYLTEKVGRRHRPAGTAA